MPRTGRRGYTNPRLRRLLRRPFVLEFGEMYYAYGTGGVQPDGRVVEVLQSPNLVD